MNEPHATVKIRLNYHSPPQTNLEEVIAVAEHRLRVPPAVNRGSRRDGTVHHRIRPGVSAWSIRPSFTHSVQHQVREQYQEREACGTERVGYGATARTQTRYCNRTRYRTVFRTRTVVDGACDTRFLLDARAGSTYVVQFDYFGHHSCAVRPFIERVGTGGQLELFPL